ncbi:MAG: hypothetical protein JJLCMIEE_01651 [Acidimicrobiales bacterium]|nr:hypothetical protein [Acidimicrobiales bacterium]
MELKPGMRLRSTVCETEVIVTKGHGDLDVGCGGQPLVEAGAEVPAGQQISADATGGTQMGKRYVDDDAGLELLCTRPGAGSLTLAGEVLPIKGAKPLPASD